MTEVIFWNRITCNSIIESSSVNQSSSTLQFFLLFFCYRIISHFTLILLISPLHQICEDIKQAMIFSFWRESNWKKPEGLQCLRCLYGVFSQTWANFSLEQTSFTTNSFCLPGASLCVSMQEKDASTVDY